MLIKRLSKTGSNDLHVVYRPCKIDEFVGNKVSKSIIKSGLDSNSLPHTMLFTGPASCGKTTAARIVALGLNCESVGQPTSDPCLECDACQSILSQRSMDVIEINVGKEGGKADVDAIVSHLSSAPFDLRRKVIIFDEAHKLTDAAKDLLLKPTEDGFFHVYYIFCTNHPEKLKAKNSKEGEAFLDRCTILNFNAISKEESIGMLRNICEFEGVVFKDEILELIAFESGGVPRKSLVWLNQIIHEGSWEKDTAVKIMRAVADEEETEVIELCKWVFSGQFKKSCVAYEKVNSKGAESLRIAIAGYLTWSLKRSVKQSDGIVISNMLDIMLKPIYESGKLGDMVMYNRLFKATLIVRESKIKGDN